jgi:hypothetical protein
MPINMGNIMVNLKNIIRATIQIFFLIVFLLCVPEGCHHDTVCKFENDESKPL